MIKKSINNMYVNVPEANLMLHAIGLALKDNVSLTGSEHEILRKLAAKINNNGKTVKEIK